MVSALAQHCTHPTTRTSTTESQPDGLRAAQVLYGDDGVAIMASREGKPNEMRVRQSEINIFQQKRQKDPKISKVQRDMRSSQKNNKDCSQVN